MYEKLYHNGRAYHFSCSLYHALAHMHPLKVVGSIILQACQPICRGCIGSMFHCSTKWLHQIHLERVFVTCIFFMVGIIFQIWVITSDPTYFLVDEVDQRVPRVKVPLFDNSMKTFYCFICNRLMDLPCYPTWLPIHSEA
jgi:hypothetical protein